MATFNNTLRTSLAAALLLTCITTGVQGEVIKVLVRGEVVTGPMRLRGTVICVACSLEEAQKAQSDTRTLYQLTHEQGQIVMRMSTINNSKNWSLFAWPPQIRVRAQDDLWQKLTAEENLLQEVEITGLLSNARTLDIFAVTIRG
jgi:hypothetical protein